MRNEFTAQIQRDGEWFVAWCEEVPEANGQGRTRDECLQSLRSAIELVLDERRTDARRNVAAGVEETVIAVG
jgi:predicted RNase H-like HicB family nuclease